MALERGAGEGRRGGDRAGGGEAIPQQGLPGRLPCLNQPNDLLSSVTTPPGGCPAQTQTARELPAFLCPAGEVLLLGSQVRECSLKSWRGGCEVEVHFTLLRVCLPGLKLGQGIQPLLGKGFEHFHGKKRTS